MGDGGQPVERLRGRALQRLRAAFKEHEPFCRMCLEAGVLRAWDELDHIAPLHKGGDYSFDNLDGKCREHHLQKTRQDMGFKNAACDETGAPLDPGHHWKKEG